MPVVLEQGLKFIVVGLANTALGLSVIFATYRYLGLSPIASNAAGYGAGMLLSFLLNRSWTFKTQTSMGLDAVVYVLIIAVAYAANLAVLIGGSEWLRLNIYLSQVLAMVTYTVIVFIAMRVWSIMGARAGRAARIEADAGAEGTRPAGPASRPD